MDAQDFHPHPFAGSRQALTCPVKGDFALTLTLSPWKKGHRNQMSWRVAQKESLQLCDECRSTTDRRLRLRRRRSLMGIRKAR